MRVFRRRAFGLAIPLLALFSLPAHSENLLFNPGFDRDLSGWTVAAKITPDPSPQPGYVEASAAWSPSDRGGSPLSGGLAAHALTYWMSDAAATATQCVGVTERQVVSFGAQFLTTRQRLYAHGEATVTFFASVDCSGSWSASRSASSLAYVIDGADHSSNGAWLKASGLAIAPAAARSVLFSVGARATGYSTYAPAWADVVADDAFLSMSSGTLTTTLLPSAGWLPGAGGASWRTTLALVNPGSTDAAVTLKFLPHDAGSEGAHEFTYFVEAGRTLTNVEANFEANFYGTYGAILMSASSPSIFLQSETSTFLPGGGTVGQALPAFGAADFAGATPKTLAPIRENAAFRTNLVLANASEIPVTAHIALFAADGTTIGSRDVDLPPLGMTQINRVAAALGAPNLDLGRIAVSTSTAGGLVAAYASVIDNVTNDPRTLLPQDATPAVTGPNLLTNPGFDRDLSGWTLTLNGPDTNVSGTWNSKDANSDARSGSAYLQASLSGIFVDSSALFRQCVPVVQGRVYGLQAKVSWSSGGLFGARPSPGLRFSFYSSNDCTGDIIVSSNGSYYPASPAELEWLVAPTPSAAAPNQARSASVEISARSGGLGAMGAYFDEVVFSEGPSIWAPLVPAAASIGGVGGSLWTTTLTLTNPTPALATAYLYGLSRNVGPRHMLSFPDVVHGLFGQTQTWLPISVNTTSPAVAITAETSTPVPGGGTVGQALAAFGPRDFAGSTPKTIAPIRDNGAFRTNLVLVNATSAPLVAHVELFDAAGASIGSRDVPLDAGAATQIGAVGWTLSGGSVDAGRLSVSTPTPGGLLAAYASVIDNVTNDPRTLLPR